MFLGPPPSPKFLDPLLQQPSLYDHFNRVEGDIAPSPGSATGLLHHNTQTPLIHCTFFVQESDELEEIDGDTEDMENAETNAKVKVKHLQGHRASAEDEQLHKNQEQKCPSKLKRKRLDKFGREIVPHLCPHCSSHCAIRFPEIPSYPTCARCRKRVSPPHPIKSHMRRHSGLVTLPATGSLAK